MTEEIIEKYKDNWDWDALSANPCLTPGLVRKFEHCGDWRKIFDNEAIGLKMTTEELDKWDMWRWVLRNNSPFGNYENFASLLQIPADDKIEQHISPDILEQLLQHIAQLPLSHFRKEFTAEVEREYFDNLFPGIHHDNYHHLLVEYSEAIISKKQSEYFLLQLGGKAYKLILSKRFEEAIELNHQFLEKCLAFAPQNPAVYFNAACLYMEMNNLDKVYECIELAKMHQYAGYNEMMEDIKNAHMFNAFINDKRFNDL